MKYEPMKMPESTAELIGLTLELLEVQPFQMDDATMIFGVEYAGGTELIFMIRTIKQIGLFRKKPAVAVIATSVNKDMIVHKV